MSDPLLSFATTFFGAFLALGLTYWYDKRQDRDRELNDKIKVQHTLKHELKRVFAMIKDYIDSKDAYIDLQNKMNEANISGTGQVLVFSHIQLPKAAFDTALFSGKFFLLGENILEIVMEQYRRMDVVNDTADDLRRIATKPQSRDSLPIIGSLSGVLDGTLNNLLESLPVAIQTLEEKHGLDRPAQSP